MSLKPEVEIAVVGLDMAGAVRAGRIMQTLDASKKYCNDCGHFRGCGDWGLCCDIKYDLCYETTEACNEFEAKEKVNG